MQQLIYPESPAGVPDEVITPSASFRRNVAKVTVNIVLFGLLYLVLLAAGIALAAALAYAGLEIIINMPRLGTIILGLGLAGVGVMVCFFLVKFLFAAKKETNTDKPEATEEEYPELFAFIRRISEETGTDFPAHIYFTPEVNAYVSYDSTLRSLFFKVPKNLTIGMGLVNMVNLTEFKAILAHEFGHFSQKSMRAGSYVYQVNKVIYNLLYENNSYSAALQHWGSLHGAFALCANLTARIVWSIQWILQQAYRIMNKSYYSLSRQMEFHADAVAAKLAGSNNTIHALRRIEFADACYDEVIDKYNRWLGAHYKGKNLFTQQRIIAGFMAGEQQLSLNHGLPVLDRGDYFKSFGRINITNQWASHPTRLQREEALQQLGIAGNVSETAAWILFGSKAAALQEELTSALYKSVKFEDTVLELDDMTFESRYKDEQEPFDYPAFYNGYYDGRTISTFDTGSQRPALLPDLSSFLEEHKDDYRKLQAAKNDLALLGHVADKKYGIRYFDFDGIKYSRSQATEIKTTVENDITQLETQIKEDDAAVYAHFLYLAEQQGIPEAAMVRGMYEEYFRMLLCEEDSVKMAERIIEIINTVYDGSTYADNTTSIHLTNLRTSLEDLEKRIHEIGGSLSYLQYFRESLPEEAAALLCGEMVYYEDGHFNNDGLEKLYKSVVAFGRWSVLLKYTLQKKLMQQQMNLLPGHTPEHTSDIAAAYEIRNN